jgi:hypothetical protein
MDYVDITEYSAKSCRLGTSQQVGKVNLGQAKAILKTWYKGEIGESCDWGI